MDKSDFSLNNFQCSELVICDGKVRLNLSTCLKNFRLSSQPLERISRRFEAHLQGMLVSQHPCGYISHPFMENEHEVNKTTKYYFSQLFEKDFVDFGFLATKTVVVVMFVYFVEGHGYYGIWENVLCRLNVCVVQINRLEIMPFCSTVFY